MKLEAVFHRMDSEYCHAIDEDTVLIRLRAKRDDLETCVLHYADRVHPTDPLPTQHVRMERVASDRLFDYFETRLSAGYPRLVYYFELFDAEQHCYFAGGRFYEVPPRDRTLLFQLPYLLREEIVSLPDWYLHSVVYQIFPDSFANTECGIVGSGGTKTIDGVESRTVHGGTLTGITENLPYLDELGISCIYLNPIFSAASYHKYDTIDYRSIDPAFGDLDSFRELVSRAHEHGIRVIIDGVFNHCGFGFFAFQDLLQNGEASPYRDWFYEVEFPVRYSEDPSYATFAYVKDMPKLNTANPEVVRYFCDIGTYWIREADIDGWRLDVANEVGHDFWRAFRKSTRAEKPDIVLIGEVWEDAHTWLQGDQLDSAMNYGFAVACRAFFAERTCDARAFADEQHALLMRYREPISAGQLNLLDSHDVPRFLSWCDGDLRRLKLAVLFQLTWVGVPSVLYGDERGMSGRREEEYRQPMPWAAEQAADNLTDYYRKLIRIRRDHAALSSPFVRTLTAEGGLLAYLRSATPYLPGSVPHDQVLVVVNNEESPRVVRLPFGAGVVEVRELLSGERFPITNGTVAITVEGASGMILSA